MSVFIAPLCSLYLKGGKNTNRSIAFPVLCFGSDECYVLVQVINGLFQAVGWPCCVACVANWFSKSSRGIVMGVWCALMIIGDMVGILGSSFMLQFGWGLSFILPGSLAIGASGLVFFFLIVHPNDVPPKFAKEMHDSLKLGLLGEATHLLAPTEEKDEVRRRL